MCVFFSHFFNRKKGKERKEKKRKEKKRKEKKRNNDNIYKCKRITRNIAMIPCHLVSVS